jgi:hypothetical protein
MSLTPEQGLQVECFSHLWKEINQKLPGDFFLVGGTLLGAVRDGHFIPHDDDIDIGIFLGVKTQVKARRAFYRLVCNLSAAGFSLAMVRRDGTVRRNYAKVHCLEHDTLIDVFPSYLSHGGVFTLPLSSTFRFQLEQILPLQTIHFEGNNCQAPADTNGFLNGVFGEDWQTPNPMWKPAPEGVQMRRIRGLELSRSQLLGLGSLIADEGAQLAFRHAVKKHVSAFKILLQLTRDVRASVKRRITASK